MPRRRFEDERTTSNAAVYRKTRNFSLGCGCCPPNRGDNATGRYPRHDRYKSVRRGRCSGSIEPPFRETADMRKAKVGAPPKRYAVRPYRWMLEEGIA